MFAFGLVVGYITWRPGDQRRNPWAPLAEVARKSRYEFRQVAEGRHALAVGVLRHVGERIELDDSREFLLATPCKPLEQAARRWALETPMRDGKIVRAGRRHDKAVTGSSSRSIRSRGRPLLGGPAFKHPRADCLGRYEPDGGGTDDQLELVIGDLVQIRTVDRADFAAESSRVSAPSYFRPANALETLRGGPANVERDLLERDPHSATNL